MLIRHLLAIAILPFVVAVVIPVSLARGSNITLVRGDGSLELVVQLAGFVLLAIGLTLFVTSLRRFAEDGKGTLAPWDPPRRLVISGPYRYVRNPMISGIVFVLFGEALLLLSRPNFVWAVTVLVINAIYIPLIEEPQLRERFGASYDEYCRHVHRLFPRFRPFKGN